METIRVPTFDAEAFGIKEGNLACHLEMLPIEIEPCGINDVKISMAGATRIVNAIILSNALNEAIGRYRRSRGHR